MRNYDKTQVFRGYCFIKIGDIISQAISQHGESDYIDMSG